MTAILEMLLVLKQQEKKIMPFTVLFLVFSTLLTVQAQQRPSNITLSSSLSPTGNSSWFSSSRIFAFGFFPEGTGFAVGIWIVGTPQTVIWKANRDDPPMPSSTNLVLTSQGKLVLQLVGGQEITIANASKAASFAAMLDSGNFVLYDVYSRIIWQSFDHPTDTLLPGQLLSAGNELVSSISEANHSTGSYRLGMQHDGNLVMFTIPEEAYWASSTHPGDNATLTLDRNGLLYVLNSTSVNVKNIYNGGIPSDQMIYRLTMDADGIARLYSHNLDQNGNWFVEWSAPNDTCDPKGICGINGYCVPENQQRSCTCFPGFVFIDQEQKDLGCDRNFSAESCVFKNENTGYVIHELENTVWEDSTYSTLLSMTKEKCIQACLGDCNCEAALFQEPKCKKQKLPLRFGKKVSSGSTVALVKVGSGDSTLVFKGRKSKQQIGILIAGIASLTFAFIVLAVSGVAAFRYPGWAYKKMSNEANAGIVKDVTLRSFTYQELEKATNGFIEKLGRGAFGTVFKGVLLNGERAIAVKRLDKVAAEGEVEFLNEMRSLGITHHRNLVRLLGYCHDKSNRLLVYEYMSNGSLADFLFNSETKLDWVARIGIALNIARGILYLHEECEKQIIHCDINPKNILMDEHGCPKISDFGLAKLLMLDQSRTITGMRGTRGYVAPEWHKNQPITVKADVYSFGVVFLEIICCRKSVRMDVPENEAILVEWVYNCFEAHELRKLVSVEEVDEQALQRMVSIGLWCIQDDPSLRPSMKKVVLMLEGTVEMSVPPSPASFSNVD